jgi:hypothetical protein
MLNQPSMLHSQQAADESDHFTQIGVRAQQDTATVIYSQQCGNGNYIDVLDPPDFALDAYTTAVVRKIPEWPDQDFDSSRSLPPGRQSHFFSFSVTAP